MKNKSDKVFKATEVIERYAEVKKSETQNRKNQQKKKKKKNRKLLIDKLT